MAYKLWIDNKRSPDFTLLSSNKDWKIARSSKEAITIVEGGGAPYFISLAYHLDGSDTSMEFLKWFAKRYSSGKIKLPENFDYYVHQRNGLAISKIYSFVEGLFDVYPIDKFAKKVIK